MDTATVSSVRASDIDPRAIATVLSALRAMPEGAAIEDAWRLFGPPDWPALFSLLDLAADLPRWGGQRALEAWSRSSSASGWPELGAAAADLIRLQALVDRPIVPPGSRPARVFGAGDWAAARDELAASHCVHVDSLLDPGERGLLDLAIGALAPHKEGTWGALGREEGPEVWEVFERALSRPSFATLTGFDPGRDEFTLTLSLQELQPTGIGWHRDLYWPAEWVGEDVFAVLYGLDGDREEKGGAFVHWVPWQERIVHHYRRAHEATVLWNSAEPEGRLLHAVSGYHGADTARHLVILQCLRRRDP